MHTGGMTGAQQPPDGDDPLRRWPSPSHSPGSFEGQLEQVGKIASGLRSPRTGWRRQVGRIGLATLLLVALVIGYVVVAGNR